jgi:hypothetical protein
MEALREKINENRAQKIPYIGKDIADESLITIMMMRK